jgi:hypothetical protein
MAQFRFDSYKNYIIKTRSSIEGASKANPKPVSKHEEI